MENENDLYIFASKIFFLEVPKICQNLVGLK